MACHIILVDDRAAAGSEWNTALSNYEKLRPRGARVRDWRMHHLIPRSIDVAYDQVIQKLNELSRDQDRHPGKLATILMIDGVIDTLSLPEPYECEGYTELYPLLVDYGVHWEAEAFVSQYGRAAEPDQKLKYNEGLEVIERKRPRGPDVIREFFAATVSGETSRFAKWANDFADARNLY